MEQLLTQIDRTAGVLDHLDRASESFVEAVANGNSRRSGGDRNRHFDVAVGSELECAACMEVCARKRLIAPAMQAAGKEQLRHIVRMIIGLRGSESPRVKEEGEFCGKGQRRAPEIFFSHERLDVYQQGLERIGWPEAFLRRADIPSRYSAGLDKTTTSLVLNIAEGNGRFSIIDQRRFLDIAHTGLMNTAAGLDLLVAKGRVDAEPITDGKKTIGRLVPLLRLGTTA